MSPESRPWARNGDDDVAGVGITEIEDASADIEMEAAGGRGLSTAILATDRFRSIEPPADAAINAAGAVRLLVLRSGRCRRVSWSTPLAGAAHRRAIPR